MDSVISIYPDLSYKFNFEGENSNSRSSINKIDSHKKRLLNRLY